MSLKLSFSIFIFFFSFFLSAQSKSVSGFVLEGLTAEPIVYALVIINDSGKTVYTDEEGYFVIEAPDLKEFSIKIRYLGYNDTTLNINAGQIASDKPVIVYLENNLFLPTIDVKASTKQYGTSTSVIVPDIKELGKVPALFGETDLLKSLTLLPGISTGLEGTSNIQIRGGNPSQTNTLLDGVSLYNTGHFGGFLSSVDPYGVKGITVYKGGVPARFGGRLSGVLDIDIRDGRKDKPFTEISIGTATLRVGREGPIGQKTKYLASARFSYPSLLLNTFKVGSFKKGVRGNKTVASMYDAIFKTTHEVRKGKISTLSYVSGDYGTLQDVSGNSLFLDEYNWQTSAGALVYDRRFGDKVNWKSKLYLSRYNYGYSSDVLNLVEGEASSISLLTQSSTLTDANITSDMKWYLSDLVKISFGFNVVRHNFDNSADESLNGQPSSGLLRDGASALEYGLYVQTNYNSTDNRVNIMGGGRISTLSGVNSTFNFEPRLRASFALINCLTLNFGYDKNTQYVHQLTTSNSIFPNDVWILADDDFNPSKAHQIYAGLASSLLDDNLTISAEVFKKKMFDLLTLKERGRDLFSIPSDWRETIATGGEGDVQGLEFYIKKNGEKLNGWIAYTLSSSQRRYGEINDGNWFPYTYDRTHDISVTGSCSLNNNWSVSANFIFQTGHAVTFPVASSADYLIFDEVNNARIPDYHRLDVSLSKKIPGKSNPRNLKTLTLGLYNVYNRSNPIDFRLEPTSATSIDPNTQQIVLTNGFKVKQRSLFPIIPSISYKWELN